MSAFTSNHIQIEAETFGSAKNPCILLIMGLGMQMTGWQDGFCKLLADRGFYVVRYDNRDVGLSTHFDTQGKPAIPMLMFQKFMGLTPKAGYSLKDMADDAVGLMDAMHIEKAHIVGASMGGMIAQSVAIHYPKRALSLTSIMSTTGSRFLPGPTAEARRALLRPVPPGANNKSPEGIAKLVDSFLSTLDVIGSQKFAPKTTQEHQALRERITQNITRSYRPWGVTRQLAAIIASPDRTPALKKLALRALVIHGVVDPLVRPVCGQATAKAIPGARLEMIPDMAHDLPELLWPKLTGLIAEHARAAA
jgi:pimeloyl-ACP methyl ester carboxylesterase